MQEREPGQKMIIPSMPRIVTATGAAIITRKRARGGSKGFRGFEFCVWIDRDYNSVEI